MRKFNLVALTLTLTLIMSACAIHNTNVTPELQWKLNVASQLNDAQNDYTTFFKDLGDAQRAGTVSSGQVDQLVAIGVQAKHDIEMANDAFKAYEEAPSADKKAQVIALVLEAEKLILQLTTTKSSMVKAGGA